MFFPNSEMNKGKIRIKINKKLVSLRLRETRLKNFMIHIKDVFAYNCETNFSLV